MDRSWCLDQASLDRHHTVCSSSQTLVFSFFFILPTGWLCVVLCTCPLLFLPCGFFVFLPLISLFLPLLSFYFLSHSLPSTSCYLSPSLTPSLNLSFSPIYFFSFDDCLFIYVFIPPLAPFTASFFFSPPPYGYGSNYVKHFALASFFLQFAVSKRETC